MTSSHRHRRSMLGLATFATFAVAVGYSPLTSADAEQATIQSRFSERTLLTATAIVTQSAVQEMAKAASMNKYMMAHTRIEVAQQSPEEALAQHLTSIGARMYGAYWCPFCTRQQELFGNAFSRVEYIECDPRGENAQPQLCASAGISAFPTWEINGQQYPGMMSLEKLAELSDYTGPANFAK
jgi:glutaredoxin